ncbi:MAG: DUF3833 domain-containing protein [Pseudomonadota bacterium]
MLSRIRAVLVLCACLFVTGCGSMKIEDFANTEPKLVLEDYFAGKTKAWGIFEDRFGDIRRQFVVDIDGQWDGNKLVLTEDFIYSDGETEQRIWTIKRIDEHTYSGTAADVVGEAVGKTYGQALNWRYTLDLKVGDKTWKVNFDDWMVLQPDGVLMNRAKVSKWGFNVGEVTIFFRKEDAAAALDQRRAATG